MFDELIQPLENTPGAVVPPSAGELAGMEAQTRYERDRVAMPFGEQLNRAIGLNAAWTHASDAKTLADFQDDPNFQFPWEFMDSPEVAGLPFSYQQELVDVGSQEELDAKFGILKFRHDETMAIAREGGWGIASNILGSLADPVAFGVDLAASAAGGAGVVSRGRRLAAAAGAAGTANAAIGALQSQVDPDYDASNLLMDFALGAALGGMFEGGSQILSGELSAAGLMRTARQLQSGNFGADSASAARVGGTNVPEGLDVLRGERAGGDAATLIREEVEKNGDIETWGGGMRRWLFGGTITARLRTSVDPELAAVGRLMVPDDVMQRRRLGDGTTEAVTNDVSVSDLHTIERGNRLGDFYRSLKDGLKGFSQEEGAGLLKRTLGVEFSSEFNRRVAMVMRGMDDASEAVKRTAAQTKKVLDDAYDRLVATGVKGIDPKGKVDNYLPRVKRADLHDFLMQKFKSASSVDTTITELVHKSILSAYEKRGKIQLFDHEKTKQVAKAYTKRLLDFSEDGFSNGIKPKDLDFVDDILEEAGIGTKEREAILGHLGGEDPTTGANVAPSNRFKHRLLMDETVSIELDDGSRLNIADLFDNDVERVVDRYVSHTSGLAALAEMGFKDWHEVDNFLKAKKAVGGEVAKDAEAAELVLRHVLGQPLEKNANAAWGKAARTLGSVNYTIMMGQIFWSMMAESGAALGFAGLRAAIQQFPAMREIMQQVATGKMSSQMARELAAAGNPGSSLLRSSLALRGDYAGNAALDSRIGAKADRGLQAAQKLVAVGGGLLPVQDVQQLYFGRMFSQMLFNEAKKGGKLSDSLTERLMDYGMKRGDVDKLMDHMRTAAVDKDGVLKEVGLDKMDPKLERKVQVMMHRAIRHIIQEPDIGATFPWIHGTTARLLTQFRGFSLVAASRRTLHSVARHDMRAGTMMMGGMTFGAAAVLARAHLNQPEDSPTRQKLQDPATLAKAAFAATGEGSIIPMLVDTMFVNVGEMDPFFNNYHRSSGLGSDAISGLPSVATIDKIGRALGVPATAVRTDRELSSRDVQSSLGLIPMNNALGIARFNRWLSDQFPSDREVQDRRRRLDLLED